MEHFITQKQLAYPHNVGFNMLHVARCCKITAFVFTRLVTHGTTLKIVAINFWRTGQVRFEHRSGICYKTEKRTHFIYSAHVHM